MAFKGTHNVKSRGSKTWRQRMKVSPKQEVTAGSLLITNSRSLKAGKNTYLRKSNIHAQVDGVVEVINKYISIIPEAAA